VSARDPDLLATLVRRNCEIKVEVVRTDEREGGLRAILNFGHTVGHALESLTAYRQLRHGEGVAIGMVAAARLAALTGLASERVAADLDELLAAFGLPTRLPGTSAAAIQAAMAADKKALAGVPRFVLPRAIGEMELGCEVAPEVVERALGELGASP
jgi:3-dehydroquinate synthetase